MSEVTEVSTVRKDRGGQRGLTHIVRDQPIGLTWCGRKPRGLAHWQSHNTLGAVTCMSCLRAFDKGQGRAYRKR